MSSLPILISDDQKDVLDALKLLLKGEGYLCVPVQSPEAALDELKKQPFSLVILDLNYTRDTTSGAEGMELLSKIRLQDPDIPAVVMTAWGSVDLAVQAMRLGANDFIEKPWDNYRLMTIIRSQLALGEAKRKSKKLERENEILRGDDAEFIAKSPAMKQVLEMVTRVAPSNANVLLTGENGTGKSMLAQFIHARSGRSNKAFVKVNMGAIPETLFESEMFGHIKGSFTGASQTNVGRVSHADGGSIFMDEVGDFPLALQPKLLRFIQDKEYERVGDPVTRKADARIIAATNRDLDKMVKDGQFRLDLLYRLNVIAITLPALRERAEDLEDLATGFIRRFAASYGMPARRLAPSALAQLQMYAWPGNVRELQNMMERAVILCRAEEIGTELLAVGRAESSKNEVVPGATITLEALERMHIERVLATSDNLDVAAKTLGIDASTLYRKRKAFKL